MAQEYTEAQVGKLKDNIRAIIEGYQEKKETVPPLWSAYLHIDDGGGEHWVLVTAQPGDKSYDDWLPVRITSLEAQ